MATTYPRIRQSLPPSVLAVVQPFTLPGGKSASITYALSYPALASELNTLNDASAAFRTAWLARIDQQGIVRAPIAYYRPSAGALVRIVQSTAANVAGGSSGVEAEVPSVCLGITKRTSFAGRRGRGRLYMPLVLRESDTLEDGTISAGVVTTFQTMCDSWLAGLEAAANPSSMALLTTYVSQASAGAPVLPDPEFEETALTSLRVRTVVRTQRRRLVRGG